tara:strand:- start:647 stop:862 length:216 start_codon:yes stop_codon:yes gene_type:complete
MSELAITIRNLSYLVGREVVVYHETPLMRLSIKGFLHRNGGGFRVEGEQAFVEFEPVLAQEVNTAEEFIVL